MRPCLGERARPGAQFSAPSRKTRTHGGGSSVLYQLVRTAAKSQAHPGGHSLLIFICVAKANCETENIQHRTRG